MECRNGCGDTHPATPGFDNLAHGASGGDTAEVDPRAGLFGEEQGHADAKPLGHRVSWVDRRMLRLEGKRNAERPERAHQVIQLPVGDWRSPVFRPVQPGAETGDTRLHHAGDLGCGRQVRAVDRIPEGDIGGDAGLRAGFGGRRAAVGGEGRHPACGRSLLD